MLLVVGSTRRNESKLVLKKFISLRNLGTLFSLNIKHGRDTHEGFYDIYGG